jgi:ABC-2 type transport system permease protein/sodium transport system permease protein
MSGNSLSPSEPHSGAAAHRHLAGRLWRLVLKELREILRDRRTIITLVVMPILIYPLLAVAFQRFLVTSISVEQDVEYLIGVNSERARSILAAQLQAGNTEVYERERRQLAADESRSGKRSDGNGPIATTDDEAPSPTVMFVVLPSRDASRLILDSSLHLAVVRRRQPATDSDNGLHSRMKWELIYRAGSPPSEAALHFVETRLQALNEIGLDQELERLGVRADLPAPSERHPVHFTGAPIFSLAALIPLILVLMTVTGAVYPAIDLTAGERERGTLETLIAAPVPRLGLLLAKYIAVLTVAVLTALVNLAGMTITAHSTGLAASLFGGMSFDVIVKVLLLLALFAAFFSAILLALTSYARSFKEAQAYIIPLMLVCLVPGVLCLIPSLEFKGWMAVTPLVNIVMLARDMLEGHVDTDLATIAVCSTVFYVAAAIALAARIFGTDAILYGSPATWSDMLRRPSAPRAAASLPTAMLTLALMFPCYYLLASSLAQARDLPIIQRLIVGAVITGIVFGGIPVFVAAVGRLQYATGLGLNGGRLPHLVAAALLGVVLWPAAHEIYLLSRLLGLTVLNTQQIATAQEMLGQFQSVPWWLLVTTLAVAPAVFEELCFRGFLFGSLQRSFPREWGTTADALTVVISALLFGVFHELLFPGRLLPSTFLGLVLGWVRLRTASVIPGMLLHALHNGLLLSIIYFRDVLAERGWGVEEQENLPITWHAVAALGILLAVGLLIATTRTNHSVSRLQAAESAVN